MCRPPLKTCKNMFGEAWSSPERAIASGNYELYAHALGLPLERVKKDVLALQRRAQKDAETRGTRMRKRQVRAAALEEREFRGYVSDFTRVRPN